MTLWGGEQNIIYIILFRLPLTNTPKTTPPYPPYTPYPPSFAGEVVGYTARDDSYVITCVSLFNHPDSLPISPTAPVAPEVGDAIRVSKKTMIRGVALARIRSRGERLVLEHGNVPDEEVQTPKLEVEVEVEMPLKMPDLAKTVPEVDTMSVSVPSVSEAPIYEEADFEEREEEEEDVEEEVEEVRTKQLQLLQP